nr:hypothetical protein [Tanacetum cinerariifolium]
MARLSKTWQSRNHHKNSSIPSKPNRAHICIISNIYAPQDANAKSQLWDDVRHFKDSHPGIMQDGVWITDLVVVKEIFADFVEDKFKPINTSIPFSPNPLFKQLSVTIQALLEASVTHEDIKEAAWSCSSDKMLGPNGITFKFIKRYPCSGGGSYGLFENS